MITAFACTVGVHLVRLQHLLYVTFLRRGDNWQLLYCHVSVSWTTTDKHCRSITFEYNLELIHMGFSVDDQNFESIQTGFSMDDQPQNNAIVKGVESCTNFTFFVSKKCLMTTKKHRHIMLNPADHIDNMKVVTNVCLSVIHVVGVIKKNFCPKEPSYQQQTQKITIQHAQIHKARACRQQRSKK